MRWREKAPSSGTESARKKVAPGGHKSLLLGLQKGGLFGQLPVSSRGGRRRKGRLGRLKKSGLGYPSALGGRAALRGP